MGMPNAKNAAVARKGDVWLTEVYRYPEIKGPIVNPRRTLVILMPKADPVSSGGKESDSRAREAGQVILQSPKATEYRMMSVTQLSMRGQIPYSKGHRAVHATISFFRPYLSASNPLGIWVKRVRILEPVKNNPIRNVGSSS